MAKTYLELVNIVLRDINEVPLSAGTFDTARGLQSFAKEAVNRSLLDIVNYNDEWPFLTNIPTSVGTRPHTNYFNTVDGTSEYSLSSSIDQIDWDNILISDESSTDIAVTKLEFIAYDAITRFKELKGTPKYVYNTPNRGYVGLYPQPTKQLKVEYISWKEPTILSLSTDTLPFEDRYYTVIVSRARYYLWMFRENSQQASMALNEYEDNIRNMYRNIMNPPFNSMRAI